MNDNNEKAVNSTEENTSENTAPVSTDTATPGTEATLEKSENTEANPTSEAPATENATTVAEVSGGSTAEGAEA